MFYLYYINLELNYIPINMKREEYQSLEPFGKQSSKKLYSKKRNGDYLNLETNHKESLLVESYEGGDITESKNNVNRVINID